MLVGYSFAEKVNTKAYVTSQNRQDLVVLGGESCSGEGHLIPHAFQMITDLPNLDRLFVPLI